MKHQTQFSLTCIALSAAVLLAACNTTPPNNAMLEQARQSYQTAQNTSQTREFAAVELKQAGDALSLANDAFEHRESTADIDHLAYLAQQSVAIAQATGKQHGAEMNVDHADGMRDKIRLMARTQQADMAMHESEASKQQVAIVLDRNQALESQLSALNAKKTTRGLVVTFGDVFFDTDQSQIKSGGMRSLDNLANFLKQYPQRTALVEGFTDNVGGDSHNQSLSGRRADAVRMALVTRGVDSGRVSTHAYGEAFPVAGNESSGGRQLNRRVEIVLSDESGVIAPR